MMRSPVYAIIFLSIFFAAFHPTQFPVTDKNADNQAGQVITDVRWRLIELGGQKVTATATLSHEPYMILLSEDNRVTGNGSCNNFSGTYELGKESRITFYRMMSTRMACPEMEVEDHLMQVFESADSYALKEDTLSLNRARMAPLARFAAVSGE
jgi:heat shock protein HslJ